jgi:hypothetical protein
LFAVVVVVELGFESGDGSRSRVTNIAESLEFRGIGCRNVREDGVDSSAGEVASSAGTGSGDEI